MISGGNIDNELFSNIVKGTLMVPVEKIQQWMKENSIDFFLINRTDEFLSEYIAPYAERLNWISNFSGSAGRCIIEQEQAYYIYRWKIYSSSA